MIHSQHTLITSSGDNLAMNIRLPSERDRYPVIIVAHGFKGFKDWGFFPYVCEQLAESGFCVVNFNFSHNGVEGHSEEFSRLDLFRENTFTREIDELREVVDAVSHRSLPHAESMSEKQIGLLGHSRGGGIVLLEASGDGRIGGVVTWAAVSTFDRYTDRQLQLWRDHGFLEIQNARTGQKMELGEVLLKDLEFNREKLDICNATAKLQPPMLIIHGEIDLSVTYENAERLRTCGDPSKIELVPVPRTGHTFGAVHPFEGTTEALDIAIGQTVSFFSRTLTEE